MTRGLPRPRPISTSSGPGGVDAQDVAQHQLAAGSDRLGNDRLGVGHRGRDWLFHEHVAARVHGTQRVGCVGVGIGVDRNRVRPGGAQSVVEVREQWCSAQLGRQVAGRGPDVPAHQARDLEPVQPVIGQGMAAPHIAYADDQNANRCLHRLQRARARRACRPSAAKVRTKLKASGVGPSSASRSSRDLASARDGR